MTKQSSIIKQLSSLYLIQRGHYLIQYPEPVGYRQYTSGQINKNGKKIKSLMDWQLEKHLEGEFTVGTFANYNSKFMTFDVDFHDPEMAKWITYKVSNALNELGVNLHYISYSGSKGYHLDIIFENLIRVEYAEKFFKYVLHYSDILKYFDDGNKVEFRVSEKLGVKLPLGIHQKSGNYCGFCLVEDGLKVMNKEESEEYLFTIQKMQRQVVLDIINVADKEVNNKKTLIKTEEAISPHNPLASYEQTEDYSIDLATNMILNGLQIQGSRNKSLFLIGLYFKYMGIEKEKCKDEMYTWMDWQNPNTYTTPLEQCYKEIDRMVDNMYEKNYNLAANSKDLTVTYDEINWIIENCPEKNQKLITYAMLIHSKRHSNKKGVFFMVFKDIEIATGLFNQAAQSQVNKLIELGVIEVVARNQRVKGMTKSKANLYRMNPDISKVVETEIVEIYTTSKLNDMEMCMKFYFTDKQLKKRLSRRQYESLIS